MTAAAAAAHPHETGGVLVGVIGHARLGAAGRPWVTQAVEVPSRKSAPSRYELPAGARERTVKRLRRSDARLGYLGDWHSHPVDVDPSRTDAAAMESISISGDCSRPLLFVVRRAGGNYDIDSRQWTGSSLRRVQVCEAGPLLAAAPDWAGRRSLAKLRPAHRGRR